MIYTLLTIGALIILFLTIVGIITLSTNTRTEFTEEDKTRCEIQFKEEILYNRRYLVERKAELEKQIEEYSKVCGLTVEELHYYAAGLHDSIPKEKLEAYENYINRK